jgi:orotate phosphoribosyltransferase
MSEDLLAVFKERGALLEGHFLLSSGLHSPRYLQCARVLMDPALAMRLGNELGDALRPLLDGTPAAAVVSPAIGGIVVGHEVARALGGRGIFTEREDGRMTLRRGFDVAAGEGVVVVEDVVTTGGSTREVIDAVGARGGVACWRRAASWTAAAAASISACRGEACSPSTFPRMPRISARSAPEDRSRRSPDRAADLRMALFRVTLAYDGTEFLGWQSQGHRGDARTVQGVLEAALGR